MIIVLIHWRIKPDAAAEAEFLDFWTRVATIDNKMELVGEFLSSPVPANQFPFNVDDLSAGHSKGPCKHFINVGMWTSWESFHEQIGKNFDDNKPMLPFEAERRSRTILKPIEWRRGGASLPRMGTCE